MVGGSSDMRDLEAAVEAGDERATMVLDVYNYRIKKYIGAYAAAMGGCDILVWTGGVGENQWATRRVVCENMEYMGMKIDVEKNEVCVVKKWSSAHRTARLRSLWFRQTKNI